ncbi:hypothetical protein QCA50_004004 [Cerrena zonata]|uniref:AB hydrolase-1 domain-containing protein n=1 Tax=Cerrena zonata TaxID=2478898 RepID=A0AAW0GS67_9APHY
MTAPSFPPSVFHSMEALPSESILRKLYPDDVYPNGEYYTSPNGRVRYWLLGPPDGDKVVLIHGISVPALAYKNIGPFLAEKGLRVLLYDLHGRGYSEAPKRVLETSDYAVQLALLLQYVGWDSAKVVGFSMGGGITAAFTSLFPHLVDGKVVFIASAGLIEIPVGEDGNIRAPNRPKGSANPNLPALELRNLQGELLPGFQELLAHDMQYGPITGLDNAFKSLKDIETKGGKLQVLIIHGSQDDIVPVTEALKIKERVPQAEVVQIEDANHYLVIEDEHWLKVATSIATFLAN